jgi:hypothetical protein
LITQDWEQDLVLKTGFKRFPLDVEIRGIKGAGAVFENVHPPLIERLTDAHVVRDKIDNLPHPVRVQIGHPGVVFLARPDGRVQLVVIRDVVAVETLRARLEIGRRITIADPERMQIRHDFARMGKGELPVELQPVGRTRNARMLRAHERGGNLDRIYRMDRIQILLIPLILSIPYIFSGTLIPSKSRPCRNTRPVNSQSANRELRAGSSDFNTGHAS